MNKWYYEAFEKIFKEKKIKGKILEIGSNGGPRSLLASKYLKNTEKVGIELDVKEKSTKKLKVIKCNSNDMSIFKDEAFDCVMSSSVLEHDKYFWKSLAEMNRVLRKGGLLILSAPSYKKDKTLSIRGLLATIMGNHKLSHALRNSSPTYRLHQSTKNPPAYFDYYRFSENTFRQVFFEGYEKIETITVMAPPHTIGYGYKL
jgi:ubiquinone/menaquinone biosynthesis C-methylase UbiE